MNTDNFLATRAGVGGLFDDSEEKTMEQLAQNKGLWAGLQTPQFQDYRPEDLQYAGDYNPEMAQSTDIKEDPQLRSQQENVLKELAGLSANGLSDVDKAGYDQARRTGEGVISSASGAALQNAQARGIAGSGMEMAMRANAAQAGADRAQQAGLQQSADSARQRALYTQAYGQDLSGVRGQDFNANSANANILNQFNMANTQAGNQAQQYNLAQRQGVSNANVNNRNQAQQYNNDLKQRAFSDQATKIGGQAGANSGMAQGYAAQNAGRAAGRQQDAQLFGTIMSSVGGGA